MRPDSPRVMVFFRPLVPLGYLCENFLQPAVVRRKEGGPFHLRNLGWQNQVVDCFYAVDRVRACSADIHIEQPF